MRVCKLKGHCVLLEKNVNIYNINEVMTQTPPNINKVTQEELSLLIKMSFLKRPGAPFGINKS